MMNIPSMPKDMRYLAEDVKQLASEMDDAIRDGSKAQRKACHRAWRWIGVRITPDYIGQYLAELVQDDWAEIGQHLDNKWTDDAYNAVELAYRIGNTIKGMAIGIEWQRQQEGTK